jgi:DNA-binding CsgD family transcriptional regulator
MVEEAGARAELAFDPITPADTSVEEPEMMRLLHPPLPGSAVFSVEAWSELAQSLQLSRRELQIVQGVFDDRTELKMAKDLDISPATVHTHMERLRRKLVVSDRGELLLRIMCEFLRLTTAPQSILPPICARRAAGRCPFRD